VTGILDNLNALIRWWEDIVAEARRLDRNAATFPFTSGLNLDDIRVGFERFTDTLSGYRNEAG